MQVMPSIAKYQPRQVSRQISLPSHLRLHGRHGCSSLQRPMHIARPLGRDCGLRLCLEGPRHRVFSRTCSCDALCCMQLYVTQVHGSFLDIQFKAFLAPSSRSPLPLSEALSLQSTHQVASALCGMKQCPAKPFLVGIPCLKPLPSEGAPSEARGDGTIRYTALYMQNIAKPHSSGKNLGPFAPKLCLEPGLCCNPWPQLSKMEYKQGETR